MSRQSLCMDNDSDIFSTYRLISSINVNGRLCLPQKKSHSIWFLQMCLSVAAQKNVAKNRELFEWFESVDGWTRKKRHILYLKSLRFFLSFCCADDLCLLFAFEEVTFRVFYEFAKRWWCHGYQKCAKVLF